MLGGNHQVILCERGIRTFETFSRNTLSLAVVPEIKRVSRLPIIADPSHGTGRRHLVAPMGNAAIACGADGLIIEVHRNPERAWCDGDQSLGHQEFDAFMSGLPAFAQAMGRTM
jgi:3-deoxy-7-phosphoheptulonate synthase